jgi:DNA-binding transcriptional MerR regulator
MLAAADTPPKHDWPSSPEGYTFNSAVKVVTSCKGSTMAAGADGTAPSTPVKRRTLKAADPVPADDGGLLSIGELAERTAVSTRTIRYYEELGILPTPERTAGGTRRYPRDYIFYVEGAKTLRQLGFGLEEIAELGTFALTGTAASKRTQALLQQKLAELEHRIRVLTRLRELVITASGSGGGKLSPVPELLRWVSEQGNLPPTG